MTRRAFFAVALAPVVAAVVRPLAFHPDAFARVSPGLSMRVVRAYDPALDGHPTRYEVLYGWAVVRPDLAARILA